MKFGVRCRWCAVLLIVLLSCVAAIIAAVFVRDPLSVRLLMYGMGVGLVAANVDGRHRRSHSR